MASMLETVFPSLSLRILYNLINFFGITIIAICLTRRTSSPDFFTLRHLQAVSLARWCVLLLFFDSWIFLAFNGLLINGVGLSGNTPCSLAEYGCIFFYATSKLFVYLFLVEKVHIVWRSSGSSSRFSSHMYRACFAILLVYLGVIVTMVVGKLSLIRSDQSCVIGLSRFASIPLLSYDLFVNVVYTSVFVWPIMSSKRVKPSMRKIASRTLVAALVALTSSSINLISIAVMGGKELSWLCLGGCAIDVIINVLAMQWVTRGGNCDSEPPASTKTPVTSTNPNARACRSETDTHVFFAPPTQSAYVVPASAIQSVVAMPSRKPSRWREPDEWSVDTKSRPFTPDMETNSFPSVPLPTPPRPTRPPSYEPRAVPDDLKVSSMRDSHLMEPPADAHMGVTPRTGLLQNLGLVLSFGGHEEDQNVPIDVTLRDQDEESSELDMGDGFHSWRK